MASHAPDGPDATPTTDEKPHGVSEAMSHTGETKSSDHTNEKPQDEGNKDEGKKEGDSEHHGKKDELKEKLKSKKAKLDEKNPPGGYDSTPIPHAEPGYTIKITVHKATNLPMADYTSLSSDPYVIATLDTGLPTRHGNDPALRMRTPTIRRSTEPEWNTEWIVANVPASGFKLKFRVYDEDPADQDDRLGNAHVLVSHLSDSWPGFKNQGYKVKKRSGSKRAYLIRLMAKCFNNAKHLNGSLYVSIEMLGRTESEHGGRAYTVGPMWYIRHYSPMLGRITGSKAPGKEAADGKKAQAEQYNFQANQFQLNGPVPAELYHRYVEFKPWVKLMFTTSGIRGWLLSAALHHQHTRVYNFSATTEYGTLGEEPSTKATEKLLDLVHWDEGGRIFTYVITLDGVFRFTETGKEFGIDMLSKHTMHSDVNIYIAYSGEFFIRRLKDKKKPPAPDAPPDSAATHPPDDVSGGPPESSPPKDPEQYELVIDNDSGTYRPNADLLPVLKKFLAHNFPGLHILTLDCNKDSERQQRMKKEQRERKKKEGKNIVYRQASRSSSISSSDISDLDAAELRARNDEQATERGTLGKVGKDVKEHAHAEGEHLKNIAGGKGHGHHGEGSGTAEGGVVQNGNTAGN